MLIFFQMASVRGDDLSKSLILVKVPHSNSAISHCSECGCSCDQHSANSMNTRKKLLFLFTLATLALLSIVILSEQLISRHLNRFLSEPEFTVFTLQDWESDLKNFNPDLQQQDHLHSQTFLSYADDLTVVESGIFWSSQLEARVPPGPTEIVVQSQLQELRQRKVSSVKQPDWLHCGRELNRFVEFQDGTKACARFRASHDEFVQGELMAFYLARLLGITNTPAVILSRVSKVIQIKTQGISAVNNPKEYLGLADPLYVIG